MPDIYNLCHLFYYYLQILLHHTRDTWAHESDLGQRDCWCNEDNDDENLMQVEGMTGFTQAGCKEIPYNYVCTSPSTHSAKCATCYAIHPRIL